MNTVYTIGHSTHPIDQFVEILQAYDISELIDVRSIPKSRHNPQFNEDIIGKTLSKSKIQYRWLEILGGLRHTTKSSPNMGWHNESFRGYADYMQTTEFTEGIEQLTKIAKGKTVAIMCAEAVPWRCHRSLIGDALLARKIKVEDIFDAKHSKPHNLTSFAKVDGHKVTYPPEQD